MAAVAAAAIAAEPWRDWSMALCLSHGQAGAVSFRFAWLEGWWWGDRGGKVGRGARFEPQITAPVLLFLDRGVLAVGNVRPEF